MRDILGDSLRNLTWFKNRQKWLHIMLVVLSLVVSMNVFWALRQPGLTLAGDAACGIPEHTHSDACSTQICICELPEEGHVHRESCYETLLTHAEDTLLLSCEQTEEPHIHTDSCYETIVTDPVAESVCICEDMDETHIHEDSCYETILTEGYEETILNCDLLYDPHEHTESCYILEAGEICQEQVLICNLEETAHIHDDTCYTTELICDQEDHIHTLECYSDENADVETQLDWQEMFADYPYTDNTQEDLVGIALTQVGYSESTLNFQVGQDGIRRGYTRYGDWYGTPYSDWSALFVSFCLHYAGTDPEEFPTNSGADSMATAWEKLGRYEPVGTYVPLAGDLVFFTDNTMGIVSEVQNSTLYVIHGDVEDSVCRTMLVLTEETIAGWGITGTPEAESPVEEPPENDFTEITEQPQQTPPEDQAFSSNEGTFDTSAPIPGEEELLDITDGPAVFIFAGGKTEPHIKRFSFQSARNIVELLPYLDARGGTYFFTLLDTNNQELPQDSNGNYIVTSGINYKLTMTVNNPEGFAPGTYRYQIPNGLQVNGGTGRFILTDGTDVGSWEVADNGLITMVFNEHMNTRTDITISATMGIMFPEQEEPLDFDGKITVTIEKPKTGEIHTKLNKWGTQGTEITDPSKLYWTVEITGRQDSHIPGSIITDQIKSGEHQYTQSDIDGGLSIGVGEYDLTTGVQLAWHAWDVSPNDPNLEWTEAGWSYRIPETITCKWCPQPITLGNNGWIYYIQYTSTPNTADATGKLWYTNSAMIDGQYVEGWGGFDHGEAQAAIVKTGDFHTDAEGSAFLWEFQATIPGMEEGKKAVYNWQIMDNLRVKDPENNTMGYEENDAIHSIVTARNNGNTYNVPNIADVTPETKFAWNNAWSAENGGIKYGRALGLLSRCNCTAENCQFWKGSCESLYWYKADDGYWYTNGFCHCWTEEYDTVFTFSYETDATAVMEAYGGLGYDLQNEALLQNTVYLQDGTPDVITAGTAIEEVPIPGVFNKELNHDFDGYTANYKITINEGKLVLTDGSPLTIRDEMTQTLAYISGSLVITTEDSNGNTATLNQGTDYTVTYDGTGSHTDENGNSVHLLDIVILHPQPVMYILDYDTTLIMPDRVTEGIRYTNAATITIWGKDIQDTTVEKVYADINIAAKSYKVEMYKTCATTGQPLGGATFGLYNSQGGLISTDVTNANGELLFQTNVIEGIILREHILYYMQELKAPPGYQLDDTKYWFCFCDNTRGYCYDCAQVMAGIDASRIPFEQIGKVHAENLILNYNLPATGGPGIYPVVLMSVMFILTPLVYEFIRRRKQERRGVG